MSRLFDEYAVSFRRGERPDAEDFLVRAGERADELAELIDAFLLRVSAPDPDEATVALMQAWAAGEPPLLALRLRAGLRRAQVVDAVMGSLGLAPKLRRKVARYYHELESGLLDAAGVSRKVLDVLAGLLGVRAEELGALPRLPPRPAAAPFLRAPEQLAPASPPPPAAREAGEWDEADQLFLGRN